MRAWAAFRWKSGMCAQAWLARFAAGVLCLITSVVLFIAFTRVAKAYLNFLALRAEDNDVLPPLVRQADQQIK